MKKVLRWFGKFLLRTLLIVVTTAVLLVVGALGLIYTLNFGPSPSARNLFVSSMLETSAAGFLATWFLPTSEIDTILATNKVESFDVITNPNLVVISDEEDEEEENKQKPVELVKVSGLTYSGNMIIVKDPSRVYVETCKNFNKASKPGDRLGVMVERENALAGINGGGFYDPNGVGTGSVPLGFVFSQGEYMYGSDTEKEILIGFDNNNKLIVGEMTGKEAKELGIRDALSFGPALVINGVAADIAGQGSGLNPRTAIGQRADGTVLLLVVNGRQANSLGATYSDLIDIMLEFGAVNAANLDGGNSSMMIFDGEQISTSARLIGDREMPACFLVERRDSDEEYEGN